MLPKPLHTVVPPASVVLSDPPVDPMRAYVVPRPAMFTRTVAGSAPSGAASDGRGATASATMVATRASVTRAITMASRTPPT